MSSEPERPEDALRFLVGALREHLVWQQACGAHGLPPAPPSQQPEPEPEVVPVQRPRPQRVAAEPAVSSPRPPDPQQPREPSPREPNASPPPRRVQRPVRVDPPELRLERLAELDTAAKTCQRCRLHTSRRNVVYGRGPVDPDIMIVGEGPGAEEDACGEPFVGKAGKLLDKMLAAMGFDRSQVYIGNIVKCRPPENRTPDRDEMAACMPHLEEQIALVRPKVIIAMGATAVRGLLGIGGITHARGKWKLYQAEIPVMPTFHPAYLLRNENAKRDVWQDLKAVLKHLNRQIPRRR